MTAPAEFEFIVIDDYSMMSVITAIEPLRVANRILGEQRYVWRLSREAGSAPLASNTLSLPCDEFLPEAPAPAYTFVCAGMHTDARDPGRLHGLLNRRRRAGAVIGAVSLAPAILARAGLLAGRRCVIHWEGHAAFVEAFPDIAVSTGLYEIDGDVMTSCGGLATLDLFLEILRRDHESWLVQAVSNQLQIAAVRPGTQKQHAGIFRLPVTAPKAMHKAIALIDQNIGTPLPPETLAREVGTSRRTLDRMFKAHTGQPIADFRLARRLEAARSLLTQTNLPILEVALATGFRAGSNFSASFRKAYGVSPRAHRMASARLGEPGKTREPLGVKTPSLTL